MGYALRTRSDSLDLNVAQELAADADKARRRRMTAIWPAP